ncbi:MAG: Tex-like N-terminal domain-containing protein [Pirellulaceae bacterium]
MIDLSGVAHHLRLPIEQIRVAADLLQQGYHPAFIERYRADEVGCLPRAVLWTLKLEIDRQMRLDAARQRAKDQLPKDAELDDEAAKFLQRATTEVEIEAALRSFRARRLLAQSQERDSQAGQLLEMLIAYDGPKIENLGNWVAEQLGLAQPAGDEALQQSQRLVSNLLQCDTLLNEKLRRLIQRRANVVVEFCETPGDAANAGTSSTPANTNTDPQLPETNQQQGDSSSVAANPAEAPAPAETSAQLTESIGATESREPAEPTDACIEASSEASVPSMAVDADQDVVQQAVQQDAAESTADEDQDDHEDHVDEGEHAEDSDENDDQSHDEKTAEGSQRSNKSKKNAKLTPRQRRRRWLIAMLQPMKTLKNPLSKLTAYQQLMLGRGRRSQLVKTKLEYDAQSLVPVARDTFVNNAHPLADWFAAASEQALELSLRSKLEAEAVADLEELAQEKLLETATDQLRQHLMRRPVRGHTIMLVDTVGPKTAAVAIVGPAGEILATDELPCSAQPSVVSQNVVKLGELAHRHRVTLVALTNGPARRFLVLTVRELMKQSASSGLRWTMADRGGAEAYAAGRVALKELSEQNRRDRAAIWIARCLQNPLAELLKIDMNRLRLGSYQRELPQGPLKKLVRDTIADCVCSRGIDTHHASVNELLFVPGVEESQAKQIVQLSNAGELISRSQLCNSVNDWPEMQARQAIGWLRVFGSDQPLDATAIHPDDYRLAQRLIDNTEFETPPAAPENWIKPQPAATALQDTPTSADPEQTDEPSADNPSAESTASSEATGESQDIPAIATATEPDPTTISPPAEASTSEAPDTTRESAIPEANTNLESTTSEAAVETPASTTSDPAASTESVPNVAQEPAEAEISFKTDKPAPTESGPKPEYPEDVVASEAATGPEIDVEKLARGWQVGREKLRWIARCLTAPFEDSRLRGIPIPLSSEMPTLDSLTPGQCVWAIVVGVADFGAFVELSPDCSGLVHISRLSANYIEDPHQCVQVGDLLMTWVVSTDEKKNRVALTALTPDERAAAEAAAQQRKEERQAGQRGRRGDARGSNRAESGTQGNTRGSGTRQAGVRQGSHGQAERSGRGDRAPGGRPQGGRSQGPRQSGGRGRGNAGPRPAKTVVVTSKKPKAVISEAMKEGEEPLRSFSDLLQFYEAKRTDEATPPTTAPAAATPPTPTPPPPAETAGENPVEDSPVEDSPGKSE